ncbi:Lacal_2735 family protein [Psychroflexus maritimus]|uniref:Lacal_2735 family protein n=1 Tax=Psychroflexus maritimus TaxID=2714865 RepID=A0A967DXS4_9FLAO|nr:Lacal_2735 family protein [Psychroflexus maritimus]NGZ89015.1 Lacal_2735 family protein [Psychroflexus maritimus]
MFGLFKKKSELDQLREQYKKLQKESFELSKTNRSSADKKAAEAEEVFKKIEALKEKEK